jgi:hypothetical protein
MKTKAITERKKKVEKCNQICFACAVLVNVFVTNLHPDWPWRSSVEVKLLLCRKKNPRREVLCVSGGIRYPRSANFRTTWRWLVIFTLRPFYRWCKIAGCLSDTRVTGTRSRSVSCEEEEKLCSWRAVSPDDSFLCPVTVLTEQRMFPSFISLRESLSSEIEHPLYFVSWNI